MCDEVKINIDVPVTLNDNIQTLFQSSNESGYNILNENDTFYQDICSTYTSTDGTDILLSDRKKDIYSYVKNLSMCQDGFELLSYNQITKKAKFDCLIEENSDDLKDLDIENYFSPKQIQNSFYNTLTNSNFRILKCFKLLLTFKFKENKGEIIMTSVLLIFIILLIIFCFTGPSKIQTLISNIIQRILIKQNNSNKNELGKNKRKSVKPNKTSIKKSMNLLKNREKIIKKKKQVTKKVIKVLD